MDLISQLKEINYSGELTYSRYNEPLAKKEIILKRLKQARNMLPNATLRINTNGDYITKEYIDELDGVGLDQLWIQQYLRNDERYDHEKMREKSESKIKKLGLSSEVIIDINGCKLEYSLSHKRMTIHIRSRNFEVDGSSRGNSVDIASGYTRTLKCKQVFNNMYIDYNGNVMVCCALRSDIPDHAIGIMGHISDDRIWDIHASDKYTSWREHHKTDGPKEGPCKTCRDGVEPEYT